MTKDEIMELVNKSLFADLGFIDSDGNPAIRRVFCTWHKGLGTHLISTNTSSMHIQNVLKCSNTCLYFENSESFEGVCFTGKSVVHFEREYKEMMWTEGDEKYYPKGIDDEDYCILEFIAEKGRFYRFDGIGNISNEEIRAFDQNATLINCYNLLT